MKYGIRPIFGQENGKTVLRGDPTFDPYRVPRIIYIIFLLTYLQFQRRDVNIILSYDNFFFIQKVLLSPRRISTKPSTKKLTPRTCMSLRLYNP